MHLQPKCPDFKGASAPWIKVFVSQREMKIIWNKLGLILVHCWAKKNSIQLKSHFCRAETNFGMHKGKVKLSAKFYSLTKTIKNAAPVIHFVNEKDTATISSAKTHTHTNFLRRSCHLKWLDSFLWTSRTQGIFNKILPSRYLPNYKTSCCFCHISKQKDLFVGQELTVPIEKIIAFWNKKTSNTRKW